jgi:hypothetical protein
VSGEPDAAAVVKTLRAPAVAVELILSRRGLVPAASGFYAWWSRRGAIAVVPHVPHPLDPKLSLLYVGISPARESSRQTVQSRVIGNHLRGNVGSSTFRFVLASLLTDELGLNPYMRGTKVALEPVENARLSQWQRQNLSLTWCTRRRPWDIEHDVIRKLSPPLNSAGNATHPFYSSVGELRDRFRRRAADTASG